MILRPQQNFTIVRQLSRPLEIDPTVFYVRAVIRNAYDETVLATVNLTDQGNNRFTKVWQVANDPGNGLWISITTSVYEDSGYTTKSAIYGDDEHTYLVERLRQSFGGGGGWFPDKEFWKKLAELIAEAIGTIPKPERTDLSKIEKAILAIPQTSGFATPEDIQAAAKVITAAISGLPKPKDPEKIDLAPVTTEIALARKEISRVLAEFGDAASKLEAAISILRSGNKQDIEGAVKKMEEVGKLLKDSVQTTPLVMLREPPKAPERRPAHSLR